MTYRKIAKYLQIEQDIITAIKDGVLRPGDKVDSESALKKKYGVSTITVRKAFTDLINSGYLYGVQGIGTFVARKEMIRGLSSISFSEELVEQGYAIDMIVCGIEEVYNESIAEKFGLSANTPLICVKRVRVANNEPLAYHISYLSSLMVPISKLSSIHDTLSLYATLEESNIFVQWVNENYSVREITDPNIYMKMNVPNNYPCFFVKRSSFNEQDEMVEYAETYFNKDWYSVTVNIKAKS